MKKKILKSVSIALVISLLMSVSAFATIYLS